MGMQKMAQTMRLSSLMMSAGKKEVQEKKARYNSADRVQSKDGCEAKGWSMGGGFLYC